MKNVPMPTAFSESLDARARYHEGNNIEHIQAAPHPADTLRALLPALIILVVLGVIAAFFSGPSEPDLIEEMHLVEAERDVLITRAEQAEQRARLAEARTTGCDRAEQPQGAVALAEKGTVTR